MRSALLFTIAFALFLPVMVKAQQGAKMDIEISSAVLKTAEWAGFKYMETLDLAQSGDSKSIKSLLEFSGTVDGVEALEHATTCLELIPFTNDERMASVISSLKPKLIVVLLDRFQLAQGRSKKEELKKPLQEWAPFCWKALHGERVVCNSCMHENGSGMLSKPEGLKSNKPGMQSTEGSEATGKQ